MSTWVVFALVAALAAYTVFLFNRLVSLRQMAAEGWSGIDVQLKRRADLVPNLVDTVKGYAAHEKALFAEIARIRSDAIGLDAGNVAGRGQVEGQLSGALSRLLAIAEAYPELKASNNFLELQKSLATVEDEIQMSRRYYNGATRNLNVAVETFPGNLVAGVFGFDKRDFFEIDDDSRANPQIAFNG